MSLNFRNIHLSTLIPEFPYIYDYNNREIQRYLNVFYDGSTGIIIKPVETTGRVKGATGEFVNVITDNLTIKRQYTNWYENTTTIDIDYYRTYDASYYQWRDASIMGGSLENDAFKYIDVISPYYKITNDVSTAFKASALGQEFQVLFDISINTAPYNILLDPSINGRHKILKVNYADASNGATWLKLIAVEYDASWGYTWAIKQYGGTYTISEFY